jgi:hypothetical protein
VARRIESHFIPGPAGRLEALLEAPDGAAPREAALVCHPHPRHGGTMHNKVVHRLARGLRRAGAAVLRFNFRGVNLSEGTYDHGIGEVADARAALAWMRERYPRLPLTLAGFSFGSRIVLRLGCSLHGVRRLIAVGFPTSRSYDVPLSTCPAPKIFLQSTHDQYGPREQLEAMFPEIGDPKRLIWIEAADHFFRGALDEFEDVVFRLADEPQSR